MFGRILNKDIRGNKVVTATLFLFILLAAMLVSASVHIIITLFGGIDHLFEGTIVPHFVQMTAEEINQNEINAFAKNNPLVESQQTVIMIDIDGANVYL
jgi:putative ABC transport system permease protein